MKQTFLSISLDTIIGFDNISNYLKTKFPEIQKVSIYRDKVMRILSNDNIDIEKIIKQIKLSFIDLIKENPVVSLSNIDVLYGILSQLGDVRDITWAESKRIVEIKKLLQKASFPFQNISYPLGSFSGEKKGEIYEISLVSNKKHIYEIPKKLGHFDDPEYFWKIYSIKFIWTFSPETNDFKTDYQYFNENGNEIDFTKLFSLKSIGEEASEIKKIDFINILKFITKQTEIINIPSQSLSDKEEKVDHSEIIPIDTFFEKIPHFTVIKEMKFSSFEKIKKQLDLWEVPYQLVKYSKWKKILSSPDEEEAIEEPQIKVFSEEYEYEIIEKDTRGQLSFSVFPAKNQEWIMGIMKEMLRGKGREEFLKTINPPEKEVILPSKAFITSYLDWEFEKIQWVLSQFDKEEIHTLEILWKKYQISLYPDRKNKITMEIWWGISLKYMEYEIEFPVDGSLPVIVSINIWENKFLYKKLIEN